MGAPSPWCEKIFPNPNLVSGLQALLSKKVRERVLMSSNLYGKKSKPGRQISDNSRSGGEELVGGVNAVQLPISRGVMASFGSLELIIWVAFIAFYFHCWAFLSHPNNKQIPCIWSPLTYQVVQQTLPSQHQKAFRLHKYTTRKSIPPVSCAEAWWYMMAEAHTEDLVIRLEESLGISNLESGPKLAGALIARKIPNRGAIKTILQNAWAIFGEAKISHIRDNLFTVVVQDEDMADQIIN